MTAACPARMSSSDQRNCRGMSRLVCSTSSARRMFASLAAPLRGAISSPGIPLRRFACSQASTTRASTSPSENSGACSLWSAQGCSRFTPRRDSHAWRLAAVESDTTCLGGGSGTAGAASRCRHSCWRCCPFCRANLCLRPGRWLAGFEGDSEGTCWGLPRSTMPPPALCELVKSPAASCSASKRKVTPGRAADGTAFISLVYV